MNIKTKFAQSFVFYIRAVTQSCSVFFQSVLLLRAELDSSDSRRCIIHKHNSVFNHPETAVLKHSRRNMMKGKYAHNKMTLHGAES